MVGEESVCVYRIMECYTTSSSSTTVTIIIIIGRIIYEQEE